MDARSYLFVCLANIHRSKTGVIVLTSLLKQNGFSVGNLEDSVSDFRVGSAGTGALDYGNQDSVQLDVLMARKADLIFVMDNRLTPLLVKDYGVPISKLVEIPMDKDYDSDDPKEYDEAVKFLKNELSKYVPKKS